MFGSVYVQEPILAVVPRPCPNRGCARYVTQLHFCHAASNMANITSIIVGVFFYDLFFYSGSDSILSKRYVMPLPPQSSSIVALLMHSSFLLQRQVRLREAAGERRDSTSPGRPWNGVANLLPCADPWFPPLAPLRYPSFPCPRFPQISTRSSGFLS